jgi:guanylate kinase
MTSFNGDQFTQASRPLLFVISGPSGVGKDSVLNALKRRLLPLYYVVTATDRVPRKDEVDGVDYHFFTTQQFEEMISREELLEYSRVYDQYKGVPKFEVRNGFSQGKDVIMRVDVQGAQKIREKFPEVVLIYLIPKSEAELRLRMESRGSDTPDQVKIRLETSRQENQQVGWFDYLVVNEQCCLSEAVDVVAAIIQAEHHRVHHRQINL